MLIYYLSAAQSQRQQREQKEIKKVKKVVDKQNKT